MTRDSLRFLWRDLDDTKRPNEYQMTVHVFGSRGGGGYSLIWAI